MTGFLGNGNPILDIILIQFSHFYLKQDLNLTTNNLCVSFTMSYNNYEDLSRNGKSSAYKEREAK